MVSEAPDVESITFLICMQNLANRIRNLHFSKIRFIFPVSITIYKVGIAEFYMHTGFGADLLKNVVTRA